MPWILFMESANVRSVSAHNSMISMRIMSANDGLMFDIDNIIVHAIEMRFWHLLLSHSEWKQ